MNQKCRRTSSKRSAPKLGTHMEKLSYLTRKSGKKDERQVFVFLMPQGKSLNREAMSITSCMVEDAGFELAELDDLVSKLTRLRSSLETKHPKKSA